MDLALQNERGVAAVAHILEFGQQLSEALTAKDDAAAGCQHTAEAQNRYATRAAESAGG